MARIDGAARVLGQIGNGLRFDGNDYVNCGHDATLAITNSITIAAWVKMDVQSSRAAIVDKNLDNGYGLSYELDNRIGFYCRGTNVGYLYTDPLSLEADGKWHQIVGIYDGSSMSIYLDGHVIASAAATGSIHANADNLTIGRRANGDWGFKGIIDEVSVCDLAWSPDEVGQNYFRAWNCAYYTFDEGAGQLAADSTGNGNDGTLNNGASWASGRTDTALSLDGVDDYVSCGNDRTLAATDAITIAAWVKMDVQASHAAIVDKNLNNGYALSYEADNKIWFYCRGTTAGYIGTAPLSLEGDGRWHYIVGTYDGAFMTIYLDGVPIQSAASTGPITGNTSNVAIGRLSSSDGWRFRGLIDDVRIDRRAWSADEVNSLWSLNIKSNWQFDEGTGGTAYDASYYDNDGTLMNGASWVTGKTGKAVALDGVDDYVDCGNDASLVITDAITIAAWVKMGVQTSHAVIVDRNMHSGGYGLSYEGDNKILVLLRWHDRRVRGHKCPVAGKRWPMASYRRRLRWPR